jgi:hypothetical protein
MDPIRGKELSGNPSETRRFFVMAFSPNFPCRARRAA